MKTILALFLILSSILIYSVSCNKKDPLGPQTINYSLVFLLQKNNQRLPDNELDSVKLYCFQNGQKIYITDLSRGINEGGFFAYDIGILSSRVLGSYSGDLHIKDYFLEYTDGSLDTLFVDYRHVTYNEAVKSNCYCYYPLYEVKYNGVVAEIDTSIKQQRVYKFDKP